MSKKINNKCLKCATIPTKEFRSLKIKPTCYIKSKCGRKRGYYKDLEKNRQYQRDNHRYLKYRGDKCVLCRGIDRLTVHHIVPQSKGGTDDWSNVMTLCYGCHRLITNYYMTVGWL